MARRVKRDEFDYFTLSLAEQPKDALCDSCGRQDACPHNALRLQGKGRDHPVVFKIDACDVFVPRIVFNNPTIPSGQFNTLRVGDKSKMYLVNDCLEIVDADKNHLCWAQVVSIYVDDKEKCILSHGHRNHTVKEMDSKRSGKIAVLHKNLKRNYHSHLWQRTEKITAIYLRRLPSLLPDKDYVR